MNYAEMTVKELLDEYSDAHKVAHGFRPSQENYEMFYCLSVVEKRIKLMELHNLICSMPDTECE